MANETRVVQDFIETVDGVPSNVRVVQDFIEVIDWQPSPFTAGIRVEQDFIEVIYWTPIMRFRAQLL